MSLKRTPWHKILHIALSIVISVFLLLARATRVSAQTPAQNWADSIDEMVAAGGYVEGQAIVALVGSEGEEPEIEATEPEAQEEPPEPVVVDDPEAATAPTADPEEGQNVADNPALTIVSQADSAIGDLTALQWSNWDTTASGVKALGSAVNASINVPNFGATEVGANMDNNGLQLGYLETNMTGDGQISAPATESAPSYGSIASVSVALSGDDISFDYDRLDGHLVIDLTVSAHDGCTAIYVDEQGALPCPLLAL